MQPGHPRHQGIVRPSGSLGGRAREIVFSRSNGAQRLGCGIGHAAGVNLVRQAMGVDWMTRDELSQAIPPVYSEFLGKYLLKAIAEMEA